jgi:hypothetical protein
MPRSGVSQYIHIQLGKGSHCVWKHCTRNMRGHLQARIQLTRHSTTTHCRHETSHSQRKQAILVPQQKHWHTFSGRSSNRMYGSSGRWHLDVLLGLQRLTPRRGRFRLSSLFHRERVCHRIGASTKTCAPGNFSRHILDVSWDQGCGFSREATPGADKHFGARLGRLQKQIHEHNIALP